MGCCFLLPTNASPFASHQSFINQDGRNNNDKNADINAKASNENLNHLRHIIRPSFEYAKDGEPSKLQSITIKIPNHHLMMILNRNDQLLTVNYRHIYQNAQGNLVHFQKSNKTVHCYYHGLVYSWPHFNVSLTKQFFFMDKGIRYCVLLL